MTSPYKHSNLAMKIRERVAHEDHNVNSTGYNYNGTAKGDVTGLTLLMCTEAFRTQTREFMNRACFHFSPKRLCLKGFLLFL